MIISNLTLGALALVGAWVIADKIINKWGDDNNEN